MLLQEYHKVLYLVPYFSSFNDLPDGLNSIAKLFADDTSLFSTVSDVNKSCEELNRDLLLINKWAFQLKMSFNQVQTNKLQRLFFPIKSIHLCNLPYFLTIHP